ncbi:MAG: glycosyltransferase, partial [Planctomycetota bacterium]
SRGNLDSPTALSTWSYADMLPLFQHSIVTVFNVPHTVYKIDEAWLRHRAHIFEHVCYPSIARQSCQNFKWLVFFGHDTPEWLKERIVQRFPRITAIYTDSVAPTIVRDFVLEHSEQADYIITSRCDNDDAIAFNYIKSIQRQFRGQEREFINLNNGVQFYSGCAYKYSHPSSPFVSLIERREGCVTVTCRPHPRVAEVAPVRRIRNFFPAWLQLVHNRNAINSADTNDPYRWPVLSLFRLSTSRLRRVLAEADENV